MSCLRRSSVVTLFVVALVLVNSSRSLAQNYSWTSASGGSWTNGTNWGNAPGDFPNSLDSRATLSSAASPAAQTVTLDAAITLRRLSFNTNQTGPVTLAPGTGGSLTLTTAGGGQPSLDVASGSGNHAITANMTLVGPDAHKWVVGAGQTLTIAGNIGGTQGMTALGTGTILLDGTNTFTGPTTVAFGTLGGSGSIAGAVTTVAGSTITAGTSVSDPTLNLQNDLTVGGRYLVTVFGADSSSRIELTGGTASIGAGTLELALGAGVTVDGLRAGGPQTYTVIDAGTGQLSGTFTAANFTNAGFAATEWSVSYDNANGNVNLNFTPIPEPGVVLSVAACGLLLGLASRRLLNRTAAMPVLA